jgi:hypothetical protein
VIFAYSTDREGLPVLVVGVTLHELSVMLDEPGRTTEGEASGQIRVVVFGANNDAEARAVIDRWNLGLAQ